MEIKKSVSITERSSPSFSGRDTIPLAGSFWNDGEGHECLTSQSSSRPPSPAPLRSSISTPPPPMSKKGKNKEGGMGEGEDFDVPTLNCLLNDFLEQNPGVSENRGAEGKDHRRSRRSSLLTNNIIAHLLDLSKEEAEEQTKRKEEGGEETKETRKRRGSISGTKTRKIKSEEDDKEKEEKEERKEDEEEKEKERKKGDTKKIVLTYENYVVGLKKISEWMEGTTKYNDLPPLATLKEIRNLLTPDSYLVRALFHSAEPSSSVPWLRGVVLLVKNPFDFFRSILREEIEREKEVEVLMRHDSLSILFLRCFLQETPAPVTAKKTINFLTKVSNGRSVDDLIKLKTKTKSSNLNRFRRKSKPCTSLDDPSALPLAPSSAASPPLRKKGGGGGGGGEEEDELSSMMGKGVEMLLGKMIVDDVLCVFVYVAHQLVWSYLVKNDRAKKSFSTKLYLDQERAQPWPGKRTGGGKEEGRDEKLGQVFDLLFAEAPIADPFAHTMCSSASPLPGVGSYPPIPLCTNSPTHLHVNPPSLNPHRAAASVGGGVGLSITPSSSPSFSDPFFFTAPPIFHTLLPPSNQGSFPSSSSLTITDTLSSSSSPPFSPAFTPNVTPPSASPTSAPFLSFPNTPPSGIPFPPDSSSPPPLKTTSSFPLRLNSFRSSSPIPNPLSSSSSSSLCGTPQITPPISPPDYLQSYPPENLSSSSLSSSQTSQRKRRSSNTSTRSRSRSTSANSGNDKIKNDNNNNDTYDNNNNFDMNSEGTCGTDTNSSAPLFPNDNKTHCWSKMEVQRWAVANIVFLHFLGPIFINSNQPIKKPLDKSILVAFSKLIIKMSNQSRFGKHDKLFCLNSVLEKYEEKFDLLVQKILASGKKYFQKCNFSLVPGRVYDTASCLQQHICQEQPKLRESILALAAQDCEGRQNEANAEFNRFAAQLGRMVAILSLLTRQKKKGKSILLHPTE